MIQQRIPDDGSASSDELRLKVQQTRARVSDTIDSLGHELSPKKLIRGYVDDSSDALAEIATDKLKQVAGAAIDHVKRNPVPFFLIAAGIVFASKSKNQNEKGR
ncbi:DUF3618 domain-containing protein [Pelagicoccus albus]|uniref:DUF3618 domain-containing protein n=1 Tax=Pelagicoccus albus TaxID=415222 RepID=A0A7X1BA47_9BACT|nr:DUF3618 domain-containing protein [Pelagicoccus albus]MBC2607140.1 DUF3618 domain-containing protein [Pelagicoccus albus]